MPAWVEALYLTADAFVSCDEHGGAGAASGADEHCGLQRQHLLDMVRTAAAGLDSELHRRIHREAPFPLISGGRCAGWSLRPFWLVIARVGEPLPYLAVYAASIARHRARRRGCSHVPGLACPVDGALVATDDSLVPVAVGAVDAARVECAVDDNVPDGSERREGAVFPAAGHPDLVVAVKGDARLGPSRALCLLSSQEAEGQFSSSRALSGRVCQYL